MHDAAAARSEAGLAAWISEVTGDPGPFEIEPLAGGNSNETLLVRSRVAKRILRRPPGATIDASAHSVEREYRILSALDSDRACPCQGRSPWWTRPVQKRRPPC